MLNNVSAMQGTALLPAFNYEQIGVDDITVPGGEGIGISVIPIESGAGDVNLSEIGPNAAQLARIKIKIQDCSALANLSFDSPEIFTSLFTLYTTFPTSSNTMTFDEVDATDTENAAMCGMQITSFSPDFLNGGVGDILTINGSGFGTSGTVQMKNASVNGGIWITLDSYDITQWSDNQIKIRIPSAGPITASAGDYTWTPGTGNIRVFNGSDNSMEETSQPVHIHYSRKNYQINNSNTVIKGEGHLIGIDDVEEPEGSESGFGYIIYPSVDIAANSSAMQCIRKALLKWTCLSNIRWLLSDAPVSVFNSMDAISTVRFGDINTPNIIAETDVFIHRCSGSQGGATEIGVTVSYDMVFEFLPDGNPWFYDSMDELPQTAGAYDFYALALHELGHAHLLQHVIDEQDIMHGLNSAFDLDNSIPLENRRINFSQGNSDGGVEIVVEGEQLNLGFCFQIDVLDNVQPNNHEPVDILNCDFGLSQKSDELVGKGLRAVPNPMSEQFVVQFTMPYTGMIIIRLYSALGALLNVEHKEYIDAEVGTPINLNDFPNGMYFCQIQMGSNSKTIKIIKQ